MTLIEFCQQPKLIELAGSQICKRPNYAPIDLRYQSFSSWKYGDIQDTKALAEAGFYYTNEEDRVRCFMCDGGLCNWDRTDIPWYEHARWYGNCPYVQQCKQHRVVAAIIETATQIIESRQVPNHHTHHHSHHHQNGNTQCDPNGNSTQLLSINKASPDSQSDESVQATADEMNNLCISESLEKDAKPTNDSIPNTANSSKPGSVCESLKSENESLKSSVMCKVCMEKRVGVIFLPCSHLVCCMECGLQLDKCPLCRGQIKATAAVYL